MQSRVAPKPTTIAPPPTNLATDSTPSTGEVLARSSLESSQPYPPSPQKDKGPTEDQSKKKKWVEEGNDAPPKVLHGSFLEDVRRKARCERYTSFNPISDFRGRVVNMEDLYGNLPYRIFLTTQYMNESITNEEWRLLNKCVGIESLKASLQFSKFKNLLEFL